MNGRTRTSLVATAGSRNVVLAVDTEISAPTTGEIQVSSVAQRFGLSRSVAAVIAAHCFAVPENWRGRI